MNDAATPLEPIRSHIPLVTGGPNPLVLPH